ncbi:methionine ABC transporter ATP-binding protein [Aminithiophilus ramosus]|uniref:Methionine ABC transporter ATP-binding protein n=2 Tax=Synergistales TaxID=649776 RepID=A0A9Q7AJ50_9BACT|nr:methionine ABC transporter ATP-binding protein [Aminithiophilus ramosus]QTX32645.1 methionine ABC transporter ATP-binding protein [Aminithiophilus ramosus]QVL36520.1 methionine ABC transporter ATP-binding protein [Synergistota bacterium]
MAISLRGLTKVYGTGATALKALDAIDLDVPDGSIFGIIGSSGAGKSTLIRCVNLLERPTAGTVIVGGVDFTALAEADLREARKKVGMIFQSFNLLARRTVFGNVALPLELAGWSKEKIGPRVDELLDLVGLADRRNHYPSQLSGGQKQRVGIARALANGPDVLLSDEATSALDPKTTQSILELLRDINERLGLTILLITHEMNVIKAVCHNVAVIDEGRIVEQGPVLDVFTDPRETATRDLLGEIIGVDLPDSFGGLDFSRETIEGGDVVVQLRFFGNVAAEPVMSDLVRRFDVDVNILTAHIDHIRNVPYGTLVVGLSGDEGQRRAALKHLESLDLKVEVVGHVGKALGAAV